MRHYSHMHGLGEPISLTALGLYVAAGFVLAKVLKKRDTLTPETIERAQVLRERLAQSQLPAQSVISEEAIAAFVDQNADLLDASRYASGLAPSKADLVAEIKAVLEVYNAQRGQYSAAARTFQGLGAARGSRMSGRRVRY